VYSEHRFLRNALIIRQINAAHQAQAEEDSIRTAHLSSLRFVRSTIGDPLRPISSTYFAASRSLAQRRRAPSYEIQQPIPVIRRAVPVLVLVASKPGQTELEISYDGARRRWANERDAAKYVELIGRNGSPIVERTNLSDEDARSNRSFLGLRLMRGIDLANYEARFGRNLCSEYNGELDRLMAAG